MESNDGAGFSGVVRISNVSDFIAPSKNCIIPLSENTRIESIEEPLVGIGKRKRDTENTKAGTKKAVKVTLNDCLACSGCITSAETILIDAQSLNSLLKSIETATLAVITVSPQSVCSIAAKRNKSAQEAARLIASYFFSKGVRFVLDSSIGRLFSLEVECNEFQTRSSEAGPILSSICPGFVCYAEKSKASLVPLLSRARSPQAVMGAIVKRYLASKFSLTPKEIFHATVMPCYDKKLEASRNDFEIEKSSKEVDCVISSGELENALDEVDRILESTEPGWLGDFGRGKLLGGFGGSSGGYAENVVNYLMHRHQNLTKEVSIPQKNLEITRLTLDDGRAIVVAKVYGFKNIQNMVRKLNTGKCNYDYVEVMACPGGCGNGGGQVRPQTEADREMIRLEVERLYMETIPEINSFVREEIVSEWKTLDPGWESSLRTDFRPITRMATNLDY